MRQNNIIQISMTHPCSESCDKMTPQEQGRFCDHCKRCVVDFTGFSDKELYQYCTVHAGERICGKVHTAQLNRTICIPHLPNSLLYKLAVAAGLALIFTATTAERAFAQSPLTELSPLQQIASAEDSSKVKNSRDTFTIHGTVYDETKEPMIGAVLELLNNEGEIIGGTITDVDGMYKIRSLQPIENYSLKVKYTAYKTSITTHISFVQNQKSLDLDINMELDDTKPRVIQVRTLTIPMIDRFSRPNTNFNSDKIEHGAY